MERKLPRKVGVLNSEHQIEMKYKFYFNTALNSEPNLYQINVMNKINLMLFYLKHQNFKNYIRI